MSKLEVELSPPQIKICGVVVEYQKNYTLFLEGGSTLVGAFEFDFQDYYDRDDARSCIEFIANPQLYFRGDNTIFNSVERIVKCDEASSGDLAPYGHGQCETAGGKLTTAGDNVDGVVVV